MNFLKLFLCLFAATLLYFILYFGVQLARLIMAGLGY